jgi:hypothetical protein
MRSVYLIIGIPSRVYIYYGTSSLLEHPYSSEELDGPAISTLRRAIAEVKQRCFRSSVLQKARKAVGPGCICSR